MIPESIDDLSVIATNNVPQGGDNVGGTLDDILRAIQAIMKRDLALKKAETAEGTSFTPGDDLNSTTVQEAIEEVSDLAKSVDIGGYMKGMIVMWSGATSNIPDGWALCNGANGTPDLRGRFVIGAGGSYAVGNTGGGSIPSHSHGVGSLATNSTGSHSHTGTAASAGSHNHSASTNSTGSHSHSGTASSAGAHTHTFSVKSSTTSTQRTYIERRAEGATLTNHATSSAGAHTHSLSINSAGGHSHTVSVGNGGAHTHTVSVTSAGAHTHTISGSTAAAGSGSEVIAKYYALCFIMKL